MDLNTITEVAHPRSRERLPLWTAGDAWLAGGTFLFSEPQAHLARLIDLTDLKWPALSVGETALTIAATCTVAQLDGLVGPPDWIASPLINQCCRAFLASFKIWKTATVGGKLAANSGRAVVGFFAELFFRSFTNFGYYGGYGYPYYDGYYGDEGGCYVARRRVHTPSGWRIRRVEICG